MKTGNYNVVLNQGADFSLTLLISDSNGPIDITGYSFSSVMKTSTDPNETPVATFVFVIAPDQTANKGQVQWSLPAATSEALMLSIVAATAPGCRPTTPYVYDILMTDLLNNITRILQGLILVSPGVTSDPS